MFECICVCVQGQGWGRSGNHVRLSSVIPTEACDSPPVPCSGPNANAWGKAVKVGVSRRHSHCFGCVVSRSLRVQLFYEPDDSLPM